VPPEVLKAFGMPEFSFEFELGEGRKLAKEDSAQVLANLKERGFHLQFADDLLIEQQLALKGLH
jgi:uncharacterized protein YcgL (UPF0745 family)